MLKIRFAAASPSATAQAIPATGVDGRSLLARLDQHDFKDEPEDSLAILTDYGWRVLVGLGDRISLTPAGLRRIGGALFAALAHCGIKHLAVDLDVPPDQAAELAYGMTLRCWRPAARYRLKPDPEKTWHLAKVTFVTKSADHAAARFDRLQAVARGVHLARDLVVAPGNELTPAGFVAALGRIDGVRLDLLDPRKAGLRLLQAVGQGSAHSPCLALLRWTGGPQREAPVVLVGKGITFDTGGIDIKPRLHLEAMKGDMGGGAAVAGAMAALAARKAAVNVVGVIAIAENMLSGSAVRPGDVVAGYGGKTVEIIDTDAEGRLVLADALAYAADQLRPRVMIDLATLTGAVEVTLGWHRAGLFSSDNVLADRLFAAGEAEDEKLWRLPLTDRYDEALASPIADLRNCTWERGPDALHAARFLQHFVPKSIAWAHLDIAGLSEADEDGPLAAEGPTGFGVRLLDRLIADHYEHPP